MGEMAFETATELARRVRERQISSLELTEYFIDRIERLDGAINAVVVRDFERAREAARRADEALAAGQAPGRMHGVPMTIKESYNIAGLPTTWGMPELKDFIAQSDAHVVTSLKAAGAVFLGKTNVPIHLADFQSYNEIYGTTNNPWDVSRIPGGSSGGSAAALATGFAALDFGSDIGGSIRNPAHYSGVYGHKPSWGIVPTQGHALPTQVAAPDIAVCGPLARSAEDLALAMDLAAGPEPLNAPGWRLELPKPQKTSLSEFRVAIWPSDDLCPVDSQIADRVVRTGDLLAKLGATVSDTARPDFDLERGQLTYLNLLHSIMGAGLPPAQLAATRAAAEASDPQDQSLEAIALRASVLSHGDWLSANNQRERLRYAWRAFFDDWDILICPQTATTAFEHDHTPFSERSMTVNGQPQPYFQQLFWAGFVIASYLPSTVFPTGVSPDGLPIGLQAVGAQYQDLVTIDFTRLMAQQTGGFQPPPDFA